MIRLKTAVAILILAVFVSACQADMGDKVVPPTPPPQKEQIETMTPPQKEQTEAQSDEIYIGRDKVPGEVAQWAEANKAKSGVSKKAIDGLDAYLISLGEKPTAGYEIKVTQAGFDAGIRWIIDFTVTQPVPGESQAQVITYPSEVLTVPAGTPVKLRLCSQDGECRELSERQPIVLPLPEAVSMTVRPAGEYFLYPGPDAVFLALPQAMVQGGSIVEVLETGGEWVHLRSGDYDGWLPKWYLKGADEEPVRENVMDYLILKEDMQGLLYPGGPGIVDLEKGKLLKPLKEWKDWYFAGIIVYDIPAVQCAWVPKDALLPIGEMEPREGFLHEGTEVYGYDSFEANGPVNPEILPYTMSVFVRKEKDGYIAVDAAGGWTAWTKKENLKMSYESGE